MAGQASSFFLKIIVFTSMKKTAVYCLLTLLSVMPLTAELVFDAMTVSVKATLLEDKTDGVFTFTNTGDYPVTIKNIKTSCGCTTTSLEKKVYLPVENGSITATLTLGDRVGQQRKQVTVTTDDATKPSYYLMLEVEIPEVLRMKPARLYWRKGEERTPKSLIVEVVHNEPANVTEASCSNPQIKVEFKELEKGKTYEVTVIPKPEEKTRHNKLIIQTDVPQEKPKKYIAYLVFQ